jgi:hypothetical protein
MKKIILAIILFVVSATTFNANNTSITVTQNLLAVTNQQITTYLTGNGYTNIQNITPIAGTNNFTCTAYVGRPHSGSLLHEITIIATSTSIIGHEDEIMM